VKRLSEAGYLRVPVVEDPGSFAVRGALVDVWPPNMELPARVELYGDLVLSIKLFDPYEQRTLSRGEKDTTGVLAEIVLPPAREAMRTRENAARAKDRVQQLCDMIDLPTTRARALVDDVVTGRGFFGAEGFLPAYYEELEALMAYVGERAVVLLEDPGAITRAVRDELERAENDAAA